MEKEIFFNELSLNNRPKDYKVLTHLRDCYNKLKTFGFTVCRVDAKTRQELLDYLISISGASKQVVTNFFYSFFVSPFEKNDLKEEKISDYLAYDFSINGEKPNGYVWAYVFNTLLISLFTSKQWDTSLLGAENINNGEIVTVHHGCNLLNLDKHSAWVENLKDIVLSTTRFKPDEKKFHVRCDHGQDKLKAFWHKIKKCEYVESCINSLPFNGKYSKLVKDYYPDGTIELVLYWLDCGYGMVIQTTGKNYKETGEIAKILTEKYSNQ